MKKYRILLDRLKIWQRRDALHRGAFASLHGTLVGIFASVLLALVAITTESLQAANYIRLLALGGILGFSISLLLLRLKRPTLLQSARRYEGRHNLKERISTAIELHDDENISSEWKAMQLNDAYTATDEIDPRSGFDWHLPRRDWASLVIVAVLAIGTWFYGQGAFEQAFIKAEQQAQIDAQVNEIEELVSEIEKNETLSEAEREQITAPLQAALEELNQAESMEEAVSILSDAQQSLDELSQAGNAASAGLQEASQKLAEMEDSTPFGDAMRESDFQAAAEALREMDAENRAALANELAQAADAMQQSNPELAQEMQQAADALQQEMSAEQLQQALEQAADAMQQANKQMEMSQAAEQSSKALESSQESLMQSGSEGQPQDEGQPMAGEPQGEQAGSGSSESGAGAPNSAPAERIESEGESAGLDPSGESGAALGKIASQFEQSGESIDSYESFYAEYEKSAWESLQSDAVPLALRSVVRDYFSSLNP